MQNDISQQFDRYRITEPLVMGEMAVVNTAYDTRLELDAAIKLIRTGLMPPDQYARQNKSLSARPKLRYVLITSTLFLFSLCVYIKETIGHNNFVSRAKENQNVSKRTE